MDTAPIEKRTHRTVPPPRKLLKGFRILVLDDEPDVRVYLGKVFKDQGAEVLEASDARQALRIIRTQKPDLLTLDLILPKKTGEKLYWELKTEERFARMPVIVVSGYSHVEFPMLDFHAFVAEKHLPEPEAFIEKPVDVEKLVETVAKALRLTKVEI